MTTDVALSILIEQNWFAQESYHRRKRQELSPSKDGATSAARRQLTKAADAAWEKTEAALWQYRATHTQRALPRRDSPAR